MVEIEGERVLAASCVRKPTEGMSVRADGERVESNRKIVFDLLASDMPSKDPSPDPKRIFGYRQEMPISAPRASLVEDRVQISKYQWIVSFMMLLIHQ